MKKYSLMLGDCLEKLKELDSNSIDSIITDPPYGISFMGKKWDYSVPSVDVWEECFRVLKPGGHLLSFSSPRTYHRIAVYIEDANFEIRDQIMWVYGSGFPKSYNLKGEYKGWGTALKPAHEPIVMARKPLSESTVLKNVEKYSTGAINIDACRIGTEEIRINKLEDWSGFGELKNPDYKSEKSYGRWAANFIHDGSEEVLERFPIVAGIKGGEGGGHQDKYVGGKCKKPSPKVGYNEPPSSAGRFFYCSKANKKDREEDNIHPTVKPTDLMKYLCRLVTPKNGIVLDPFMGSGSTGKAAILEGFNFIGIELSEEYYNIAMRRMSNVC